MTVNANVRCIEWFDTYHTFPTNCRYVIGWYPQHYGGMCIIVKLDGERWVYREDFIGLPVDSIPSHWCEFPEGPGPDLPCFCEVEEISPDCPKHGSPVHPASQPAKDSL